VVNPVLKKKFTSAVDQLDEFIDRFNHQDPMFLEAFPNRPKRPLSAERAFLVKTLFDPHSNLDPTTKEGFLNTIVNPSRPQMLDFADRDWYASLNCKMLLDGKPVTAKMILRFELDSNGATAWRIQSASAPWLHAEAHNLSIPNRLHRRGLNPASHGNGFISMHRAFLSPETFPDNLADSANLSAKQMAALVVSNRLKLDRITTIQYHFLQINGYLFTVADITAPEGEPSGFLINRLVRASSEEKRKYKRTILHLQS
jgi:hypothetical protein